MSVLIIPGKFRQKFHTLPYEDGVMMSNEIIKCHLLFMLSFNLLYPYEMYKSLVYFGHNESHKMPTRDVVFSEKKAALKP